MRLTKDLTGEGGSTRRIPRGVRVTDQSRQPTTQHAHAPTNAAGGRVSLDQVQMRHAVCDLLGTVNAAMRKTPTRKVDQSLSHRAST